ncbi:MAG: LLM class F420-dependent oxidoreductase [Anaerolineales bacterium]|nr:LLM class F420-dependent oxidoreductase [Anaerolineales bacterium]
MKLGVVFPQNEFPLDPIAIRDFGQTAEGLGFDYVLVYDHVLGANPERPGGWQGPYTHKDAFHEPFVLFSHWAALTQTLEFVTGILILPQRQTALVAKQAASLDFLSGGRLRLGVGVGWNAVEYTGLGQDFNRRGKRMEAQVEMLRRLWTEPLVTMDGDGERLDDVGLLPMPVQRPIPIWMGGYADVVLRRMARLADGWFPGGGGAAQLAPQVTKMRSYLEEAGRDPATFGIDVWLSARQSEQELTREAAAWREMGATHMAINTLRCGYETAGEHLARIEALRKLFD